MTVERTAGVWLSCGTGIMGCRVFLLDDGSAEITICSQHEANGLAGVAPKMLDILEHRLAECSCLRNPERPFCRDCSTAVTLTSKINALTGMPTKA
jgi:hypothetical protein